MPTARSSTLGAPVGVAQDHPAVAVAVVLGGDRRAALAAGGRHDLFHFAQRGFELARGERLEDDRGASGGSIWCSDWSVM